VEVVASSLAAPPAASDDGAEPAPPAPRKPAPGAQPVWLESVEDRRTDPSLGDVHGRPFSSTQVSQWLERELESLVSPTIYVMKATGPGAGGKLWLRARILKAYVSGVGVTKTATVVLEIDFVAPDGSATSRVFRGQHASMNWWNTEGEVIAALREAGSNCLEQIRLAIEARLRTPDLRG